MYHVSDTIAAVSSPSADRKVLIRISGPETIEVVNRFFTPRILGSSGIISGKVKVDDELAIDAEVYLFKTPHSYTGQDLAEIHINSNSSVTEALLSSLLADGLRMAEPGEFTARAYLNGKMDLTQAEAVNEVIVSSNRFQLAAAENLLAGRLTNTTVKV